MGFDCAIPGPPLSSFVALLWSYDGYAASHVRERLLPTATMELVIRLETNQAQAGVSGARSKSFEIDTSRPFNVVGVHFKPGGGFPFFEPPAGELRDLAVPLEALWSGAAERLCEQLFEAPTSQTRFRILERALLERSPGRLERHPAVQYALEQFDASPFRSIAEMTSQIGLAEKRFTELFCDNVGLTPKLYCRIRRFQNALVMAEHNPEVDWTEIAVACGYFDQAHFNHDFRSFSGVAPSVYLRHRTSRNHVALDD